MTETISATSSESVDQEALKAAGTQISRSILDGFAEYRDEFEKISISAQLLFERADWHGTQNACLDRIKLYDLMVSLTVARIESIGADLDESDLWYAAKQDYSIRILDRTDPELAETFFNSIFCRKFSHHRIDEKKIFVRSSLEPGRQVATEDVYHTFSIQGNVARVIGEILEHFHFNIPYENKRRDIRNLLRFLRDHGLPGIELTPGAEIQIIDAPFFRNKGAYLVGKVVQGSHSLPFIIPILNNERGGVYVDTLIFEPDDVSIIFSFTRSYFLVRAEQPIALVHFLYDLMEGKTFAEMYACLGFYKHGKTVFYRKFLDHLARTNDKFIVAPGIKGMVMTVFTLPSLNTVFKVIKDKFAPPKDMTKDIVKEKYLLVKRHDKAGRMADTQEFKNLSIPRDRFSDDLLEELMKVASSSFEITEDRVIISHVYTERRMTPLNLYIDSASEEELRNAIEEYGNAIRQLAAANIFPGDMLFKNFGVTRHGRVVFYDYDEICYLTECNFRHIPPPRYPEDELLSEPWYSVAPNDVFPEEFRFFLTGRKEVEQVFKELHSPIFEPEYWQGLQNSIVHGEVMDVFPYRRKKRFDRGECL